MPGADDGLAQIHRGNGRIDATAGHVEEGVGERGIEFAEEGATADAGCIQGTRAADEDDAGGEGVGAGANHAVAQFRAHRPGAGKGKTSTQYRLQKSLPAGAVGAAVVLRIALLEGVVNSDGERRVRLYGEVMHGTGHAVEEEGLRFGLTAVPIGRSHQFFGFGHGQRGVEIRENWFEAFAEPDVEKV